MWILTQRTPLDATEPTTIKSISLSNTHVPKNRETQYKGSLEGKYKWRKFPESSFWDARHKGLSRKALEGATQKHWEGSGYSGIITPSNLEVCVTAHMGVGLLPWGSLNL